jgi:acyl-CoA synthetase (NDP forming)
MRPQIIFKRQRVKKHPGRGIMERRREFESIFHPRSIAVVGVSAKEVGFGNYFLNSLIQFGLKGKIYPVHPETTQISGLKAYPSVKDIPEPVDLAFISIPAQGVPSVMEDCAAKGIGTVVILTAGFSETGEKEGQRLEEEIVKISRRGHTKVIGPNCFGIYCPSSGLTLVPGADFSKKSGQVAFISQSGGYAVRFCRQAVGLGIHFSKAVSYGNACDLNEADFMEYLAGDPETKIITAYLEGVKEGRRFLKIVRDVAERKPVIIWKAGLTETGARAAMSHTGALSGREEIWDAFFKQTGAVCVNSLEELMDTTLAFLHLPTNCGRRVAVIGGGGGIGVAAADACELVGLSVPVLCRETQRRLQEALPPAGVSFRNPVDAGRPIIPPSEYKQILEITAAEPQIDTLIVVQDVRFVGHMGREALQETIKIPTKIDKVREKAILMVLSTTPSEAEMMDVEMEWRRTRDRYLALGIPVYPTIERAAKALANFVNYYERIHKSGGTRKKLGVEGRS